VGSSPNWLKHDLSYRLLNPHTDRPVYASFRLRHEIRNDWDARLNALCLHAEVWHTLIIVIMCLRPDGRSTSINDVSGTVLQAFLSMINELVVDQDLGSIFMRVNKPHLDLDNVINSRYITKSNDNRTHYEAFSKQLLGLYACNGRDGVWEAARLKDLHRHVIGFVVGERKGWADDFAVDFIGILENLMRQASDRAQASPTADSGDDTTSAMKKSKQRLKACTPALHEN
jgi:hypothetical protein